MGDVMPVLVYPPHFEMYDRRIFLLKPASVIPLPRLDSRCRKETARKEGPLYKSHCEAFPPLGRRATGHDFHSGVVVGVEKKPGRRPAFSYEFESP